MMNAESAHINAAEQGMVLDAKANYLLGGAISRWNTLLKLMEYSAKLDASHKTITTMSGRNCGPWRTRAVLERALFRGKLSSELGWGHREYHLQNNFRTYLITSIQRTNSVQVYKNLAVARTTPYEHYEIARRSYKLAFLETAGLRPLTCFERLRPRRTELEKGE
jgi:hypothetical protein